MNNPHLHTVQQLYSEAQQWTRHYEALLVNASVFLVTISLAFLGFAFSDKAGVFERNLAISVPIFLSILGLTLVRTLFKLYSTSIERLIRYEAILGCFDEEIGKGLDGGGSLLPMSLQKLPVPEPASVKFFDAVFVIQICTLVILLVWRSVT